MHGFLKAPEITSIAFGRAQMNQYQYHGNGLHTKLPSELILTGNLINWALQVLKAYILDWNLVNIGRWVYEIKHIKNILEMFKFSSL